jgi:hypothetical protein
MVGGMPRMHQIRAKAGCLAPDAAETLAKSNADRRTKAAKQSASSPRSPESATLIPAYRALWKHF